MTSVDRASVWGGDPGEAIQALDASERGLTSEEAARRLAVFGLNEVTPPPAEPWTLILLRQFQSPLI